MSTRSARPLLVELFVEELPPKALPRLGAAFADGIASGLRAEDLLRDGAAVTSYATPRRLAVLIDAVAARATDRSVSHKLMPASVGFTANGEASPALLKKLAALGADAGVVPRLQRRLDGKSETLFLDAVVDGAILADGLQRALDSALAQLPIPKVMQYQLEDGWTSVSFVRPAHGLVALHGNEIVPITALGLVAGRTTLGHRFEATHAPIVLRSADTYATQLRDEGAVIASFAERRAETLRQLQAGAAAAGLAPVDDDALLDEVTALVERPNVLACEFEREFLEVPAECLVLTMKANQKYFPLVDRDGRLTNRFLVVSNISPADPSRIVEGNERVVRPRLADAKFFFDQDRKKTLASRVPALDKVVYHAKLGTQGERVKRVRKVARELGERIGGPSVSANADGAAFLAKADLLTDMVGEFPELQGIMGRYYAQHDGELAEIAFAIEDHYKPRFAGDSLPRSLTGIAIALADKLEMLVGMFGIAEFPTGDKDPFALRRHALGVVRLLGDLQHPLDVKSGIDAAVAAFPAGMLKETFPEKGVLIPLAIKVQWFVEERATSYMRDKGYSAQEVDALFAHRNVPPMQYEARLRAVRKTRSAFPDKFAALAIADKRARNILSKSGGISEVQAADESRLVAPEELSLLRNTRTLRQGVDTHVAASEFEAALLLTVHISDDVTAFFNSVMVNVEDPALRTERFRLLHEVTGLTNRVVDLSRLAS